MQGDKSEAEGSIQRYVTKAKSRKQRSNVPAIRCQDMGQEDDLRGLGKVMDFMRGISILFFIINCIGFVTKLFGVFHYWRGGYHSDELPETTGLFSSILWTKLFSVFLGLSCRDKRSERGENYLG